MLSYNIHEAKTGFSKLILAVEQGEAVVIARAGKPVAVLGPIKQARPARVRGVLKGQIQLGAAFDEPLPAALLGAFGGAV